MAVAPTVLILAAGQGTRMRSKTPKVLHDLCGLPMILWPVRAALASGASKIVVVDSPALALASVLPDGVELVVQPRSDGTGGAVKAAADAGAIDSQAPVVVLSGDVPLVSAQAIAELTEAHESGGASATVATTTLADPTGYGRVVRGADGSFERIVETKAAGDASAEELQIDEVNTGVYVFDADKLLDALPRLSSKNAQGELYLPQVLDLLRSEGERVAAQPVADERLVLGVNDRVALAAVRKIAQQAICERHMEQGVTIVDPDSTVIDVDVQIGQDATIEPGSALKGATAVGAEALVGPHTTAIDSQIGERAAVRCSWLDKAFLHADVSVGPFAYLRPGTLLHEGAKVGTFVEIKNSQLGAGAKVPHLSYVGDAEVGERTNLGASTITANYDGVKKHRTKIGRNVHGGVHTSLVAPLTVGDDAYTAAGSVIAEDVPAGALGISRARQANVEGYAAKRDREAGASHGEGEAPGEDGQNGEGTR